MCVLSVFVEMLRYDSCKHTLIISDNEYEDTRYDFIISDNECEDTRYDFRSRLQIIQGRNASRASAM